MFETYVVKPKDLSSELRAIRRAGGRIVQSSPIGEGYQLHVYWRP
jgi:hypothetical protein